MMGGAKALLVKHRPLLRYRLGKRGAAESTQFHTESHARPSRDLEFQGFDTVRVCWRIAPLGNADAAVVQITPLRC